MRPPSRRTQQARENRAVRRASYVSSHKKTGNKSETARLKGASRPTVRLWARRAEQGHGLGDAPRSGRPSKVQMLADNAEAIALLKDAVREGMKCPAMATRLYEKLDIRVGKEVVRKFF